MNPQELYRAGRLSDAIKALSAELRDNPTDTRRRTFLFELLCFAGRIRARGQATGSAGTSRTVQRNGCSAVSQRAVSPSASAMICSSEENFRRRRMTAKPSAEEWRTAIRSAYFSDADPRTGARLEIFAAGNYLLLPLGACCLDPDSAAATAARSFVDSGRGAHGAFVQRNRTGRGVASGAGSFLVAASG